MENKFWKKIRAKRESGLTAVRLNQDPPVATSVDHPLCHYIIVFCYMTLREYYWLI